jgi:hypothetical protein
MGDRFTPESALDSARNMHPGLHAVRLLLGVWVSDWQRGGRRSVSAFSQRPDGRDRNAVANGKSAIHVGFAGGISQRRLGRFPTVSYPAKRAYAISASREDTGNLERRRLARKVSYTQIYFAYPRLFNLSSSRSNGFVFDNTSISLNTSSSSSPIYLFIIN